MSDDGRSKGEQSCNLYIVLSFDVVDFALLAYRGSWMPGCLKILMLWPLSRLPLICLMGLVPDVVQRFRVKAQCDDSGMTCTVREERGRLHKCPAKSLQQPVLMSLLLSATT